MQDIFYLYVSPGQRLYVLKGNRHQGLKDMQLLGLSRHLDGGFRNVSQGLKGMQLLGLSRHPDGGFMNVSQGLKGMRLLGLSRHLLTTSFGTGDQRHRQGTGDSTQKFSLQLGRHT